MSHTPMMHVAARAFIKVDRVRADECAAVIIDDVFLAGADDAKARAERKVRPIRGGTFDLTGGKALANGVATAATFGMRVSSRADLTHAIMRDRLGGWRALRRAAGEKRGEPENRKNSQGHGKRGSSLNSGRTTAGQGIISSSISP